MNQVLQPITRFNLSVSITIFFACYSGLLLLPGLSLLQDADVFWHIRTGQWILDYAEIPAVDYFSYTAYGKPWIPTEWLSEIAFAEAFRVGGWRAVVIVTAISIGAIAGLLSFYLLRCLRFSVAIGWRH